MDNCGHGFFRVDSVPTVGDRANRRHISRARISPNSRDQVPQCITRFETEIHRVVVQLLVRAQNGGIPRVNP